MMHEGTEYTHSCRRVLFVNALSQRMLGPSPEKFLSVMDSAFRACGAERHARVRDCLGLGRAPKRVRYFNFDELEGAYPAPLQLKAPIAASHQDGMR
jgi:hypothetical protein